MTELVIDSLEGRGGASIGMRAALGRDPDIAMNQDQLALAPRAVSRRPSRPARKAADFVPVLIAAE